MSATPQNWLSSLRQDPEFKRAVERSLCKASLAAFIRLAWPVIEPDTPYLHNWHIDLIAEYLMACTLGQITRLVINFPPRYGKSGLASVTWPCWVWGPRKQPGTRWLFHSYAADSIAKDLSLKRRAILQSPWYQERWGDHVSFRRDQNEKMEYQNTRRGEMVASGMSGTLGKGGDVIVVDDPHDVNSSRSRLERESQVRFFDETLSTRLNNKFTGIIVIIMQRLGIDDLAGHVLDQGGYVHVKVPVEVDERTTIVFPISRRDRA